MDVDMDMDMAHSTVPAVTLLEEWELWRWKKEKHVIYYGATIILEHHFWWNTWARGYYVDMASPVDSTTS
jgi:hypothetical protein